MSKKVIFGVLIGIGLIIIISVVSVISMRNSASQAAEQFYSQYNHCLYSNEINQCVNELKNNYSGLSLIFSHLNGLQNLPVNIRKFNLAVIYHHSLPVLQNTHFTLGNIGGGKARIVLSGNLDWGDKDLIEAQLNLLKGSLSETYPEFILSKPLSYNFDLVKEKNDWKISDIYYTPPSLDRKVSNDIVKCKNLLKAENQESALCIVSNGKVSLLPLIFNKAGFLATKNTEGSDLEEEIKANPSEIDSLNSVKPDSLIIYVVDFSKLLLKDSLSNLGIDASSKRAFLTPIPKPDKTTSFCVFVAPLFKDGAFSLYPADFNSKSSILIDKNGYLICSPAISWQATNNNLVFGIAGYLDSTNLKDKINNPYLGFKLLLPPQSYYGTSLNAFGYDQKIGNKGQIFYRRAIPLKLINY